ncbi:hypothetical protein Lal_00030082, partial [Lupinus albus]
SLPRFGIALAARTKIVLYPSMSTQLLCLNAFRGEPDSARLEWHFTTNHNSSADSSTSVSSDLHLVSHKLQPASTRSEPRAGLLPLLGSLQFHVLFHSPMGVLFTLPSWYYFTIGHLGVFSLARWSSRHLLGLELKLLLDSRHLGCNIQPLRLSAQRLYSSPTTPFSRFRLLPFCSPLLRESLFIYFPPATKMLSLACPWIQKHFEKLTYSGISGSTLIFNSLKHFFAYYALPRLWVPRSNRRIGKIGSYHIALYRLSSRVGEKLFSKSQKFLSWNPILTKDSCGSRGSTYRRTRNGELPPFFLPDSLNERLPFFDPFFTTRERGFMVGPRPPGCRRPPWGDLCIKLFARANLILFPRIPDEETLGKPPTPTTVHVREEREEPHPSEVVRISPRIFPGILARVRFGSPKREECAEAVEFSLERECQSLKLQKAGISRMGDVFSLGRESKSLNPKIGPQTRKGEELLGERIGRGDFESKDSCRSYKKLEKRKDPKVGGGDEGTCKVTKNQPQRSPSDFGSSYVASFGSSYVTSFGSSYVTSFGSSYVENFGSSYVASFDSSYVASFGSSYIASFGSSCVAIFDSSYVASFGSSYVASFGSSCVAYFGSSYVANFG